MKIDSLVKSYGVLLNLEFFNEEQFMNNKIKNLPHSSFWANLFNSSAEKMDLQKTLKSIPIFEELSKRDFSLLFELVHDRIYIAGEYVFYQGDPGLGIYLIREGEIEIQRTGKNGNTLSLAQLNKGDFFGELALVDGEKRSASAIAKTDTKLAVIFKPDLDEFIDKFPKKGVRILDGISKIIATRLRKMNEEQYEILTKI
jgi:CRP/FNR family transcriptional regulator, cyclic AMP receptor protein